MNRRIRFLSLGVALLCCTVELAAQGRLKETPFYPLQVGTVWHYRAGDNKFTIHVVRHEKVGETLCALLETRRGGKVVGAEHLAIAAGGVYRHDLTLPLRWPAPNDKDRAVDVVSIQTLKPPILVLKLPPKQDDAWKVDSKSDGQTLRGAFRVEEQEITVPAGKFKTFRVRSQDLEVNGLRADITTHFAEGVGMVKQVLEIGDARTVIELEKFEAGGK